MYHTKNILRLLLIVLISISCRKVQHCHCHPTKYVEELPQFPGVLTHFELNDAIKCAQSCRKPLLVHFIAHGSNHEMESRIASSNHALQMMNDHFVYVNLYVDDREVIADSINWVYLDSNIVFRNIAKINSHYQIQKFDKNIIPLFAILDHNGKEVYNTASYCSISDFISFLDDGLSDYNVEISKKDD